MIRQLLNRLGMPVKFVCGLVVCIGAISFGILLFSDWLSQTLYARYAIDFDLVTMYRKDLLRFGLSNIFICVALMSALYFEMMYYLKRLNRTLRDAVHDKRIMTNFDEYDTHDVFSDISKYSNELTQLFKHFDGLKSSRLAMEVSTLKLLMNHLNEGIILIDHHRVVTHINHLAEERLGLQPGEIVGQSVSRNISNLVFLESLEKTLESSQKVMDTEFSVRGEETLQLTVLPVKDRQGGLVRALVILGKEPVQDDGEIVGDGT